MKQLKIFVCSFLFFASTVLAANAAPVIFFGEDFGLGEFTPLQSYPNSTNAEAAFLSNLTGVGTEDFTGFTTGFTAPLTLVFPGAGTATLLGSGSVAFVASGSTNDFGRYAISGEKYWEATQSFSIEFAQPIAAFGFYTTDVGDFDGQVLLTLTDTSLIETIINMGNSVNIAGGAVHYWGFYDLSNEYNKIEFGNTAAGVDFFGFDNMTVGSLQQITPDPIPEPTTMLLLGAGLLGLAGLGRKKFFNQA